jgi:hypothetical protein
MIDIVIAKYKEDTSWTANLNKNKFNVIVYNKIDNLTNPENNNLPNIGKESYAYIYYIVKNYCNLPESIIFLQGCPLEHCGNIPEIWKNYFENIHSFDRYCNYRRWPDEAHTEITDINHIEVTDKLTINLVKYLNNKNYFDLFECFGNIVNYTGAYSDQRRLLYNQLNIHNISDKFSIGAQFIVPSSYIKNKSLSFWETLLNLHVSNTSDSICSQTMPNTLEQSWIDIFNFSDQ